MATLLTKPLSRELLKRDGFSSIIVTLEPGDLLTFRYKGKRTRYTVSLHNCHVLAVMQYIQEDYNRKVEENKRKRAAGYTRLRKPRKPNLSAFSKHLRVAISTNKSNL